MSLQRFNNPLLGCLLALLLAGPACCPGRAQGPGAPGAGTPAPPGAGSAPAGQPAGGQQPKGKAQVISTPSGGVQLPPARPRVDQLGRMQAVPPLAQVAPAVGAFLQIIMLIAVAVALSIYLSLPPRRRHGQAH